MSIRRVRRRGPTESGFHNDLRKDIKGIVSMWSCKTTVRSWRLGQSFIAFSTSCRISLVVGAGGDLSLELRPSTEHLNSGKLYLRRFKCDSKRCLLVNRVLEDCALFSASSESMAGRNVGRMRSRFTRLAILGNL